MTLTGILTISLFLLLTFLLTKPFGLYLARVYGGERTLLDPVLRPVAAGGRGLGDRAAPPFNPRSNP